MKHTLSHQSGVVLLVSLIMLLLLALLGLTSMKSAILEEKIASNYRAHSIAFQNAERLLSYAEQVILDQTIAPTASSTWSVGANAVKVIEIWSPTNNALGTTAKWWQGKAYSWWDTNGLKGDDAAAGRYIIEYKERVTGTGISLMIGGTNDSSGGSHFYRITARGTSGAQQGAVLLQSIVAKRN